MTQGLIQTAGISNTSEIITNSKRALSMKIQNYNWDHKEYFSNSHIRYISVQVNKNPPISKGSKWNDSLFAPGPDLDLTSLQF